jgi:AcrR family transcriptional regulator
LTEFVAARSASMNRMPRDSFAVAAENSQGGNGTDLALGRLASGQAAAGWRSKVLSRSLQQAAHRSLERGAVFVDAAWRLMDERENEGFTLQEVADKAGQSVRTFYQHFASKDDLVLAVFEELVEQMVARVRESVEKYADPTERLAAIIIGAEKLDDREVRPLERALTRFRLHLLQRSPQEVARVQEPYQTLVREAVQSAIDARQIPECDAGYAAYFISSLKSDYYFEAFAMGDQLGSPKPSPIELARFCLRGLGAELPARFEPQREPSRPENQRRRHIQGRAQTA